MNSQGRYVLYFVLAFLTTGLQSILPQAHFSGHPHDTVWVAVCLLLGSVTSIVAVRTISKRNPGSKRARQTIMLSFPILWALMLLGFKMVSAEFFVADYVASRTLAYVTLDLVDRTVLRESVDGQTSRHAERVAMMQIAGLILAPLWFAIGGQGWLQSGVLTGLLAFSQWLALHLGTQSCDAPSPRVQGSAARPPLTRTDTLFAIYLIAVVSLATLFATSAVLIVQALYHSPHPITDAGLLLTVMNCAAVIMALILFRRTPFTEHYHRIHMVIALAFFVLTAILWGVDIRNYGLLVFLGIVAGLSYGGFEVAARTDATRKFQQEQDGRLLSLFNNAVNYGTVIAGLFLLGGSWIEHGAQASVAQLVLAMLVMLSAISVGTTLALNRCHRPDPVKMGA